MADLEHVLISGQSLSVGQAGTPTLSTVSEAANARAVNASTGSISAPLEQASGNERPEFALGYRVAEHVAPTQIIGTNTHGQGGQNIAALSKGGSTIVYNVMMNSVTKAYESRVAASETYRVRAMHWIQGETDQQQGMSRTAYAAAMASLYASYKADIAAVAGASDFPWIASQTATWAYYGNPAAVGLGQLDAARTVSGVFLACPQYHLPYAVDNLHLSNVGYYRLGEYHARAHNAIVDGTGWAPFAPILTTVNGSVIDVKFHVPAGSLVFDTTLVSAQPNMGFSLPGTSALILSVSIVGGDTVRIVTDRPVYESTAAVGYGVSSGTYAGKGNLRDSETEVSAYDGAALPNWAVHFSDNLGLSGQPPVIYRVTDRFLVGDSGGLYRLTPQQPD